jgi:hypothetical protein
MPSSKPIPTPNIQPNLRPRLNRQPRMPRFHIPRPISPQILPEHRIASHRLEYDSSCAPPSPFPVPALYKPTPVFRRRLRKPWEPRPPTGTVRIDIDHKTTHAIDPPRALPVVMMRIMPSHPISLYLQPLQHQPFFRPFSHLLPFLSVGSVRYSPAEQRPACGRRRRLAPPALQCACARFDAFHGGRAGQGGDFGEADGGVDELGWAGGDAGGFELVGAVGGEDVLASARWTWRDREVGRGGGQGIV